MSMENRAIVRRLYEEVWNKHRFELLDELISPSHALSNPNVSGSEIGAEAYKLQVLVFLKGFPDARMTIEDIVGENEKIVAAWTFSGTHKGKFMGVSATNKKVSVDGMTIHHVVNGKIIDSSASWDALSLMKQLGVTVSHYRRSRPRQMHHPPRH